jgi:hypothetical protein
MLQAYRGKIRNDRGRRRPGSAVQTPDNELRPIARQDAGVS